MTATSRGSDQAFVHAMTDPHGRRLAWFSSRNQLVAGERYRRAGTVVRHRHFAGRPDTVLARCSATRAA